MQSPDPQQPASTPAQPIPVNSAGKPAAARPIPVSGGNRPIPGGASRPVPVNAANAARQNTIVREAPPEDEEDVTTTAVKSAPPWLVSMVVHMILAIILALIALPALTRPQVQLLVEYAEQEGVQLIDDAFDSPTLDKIEETDPVFSEDLNPVDDPFAAAPELEIALDAVNATSDITAPSIGMALTGREKGMKKALLAAYGGTATTEEAVKLGLAWLKKQQEKGGTWSISGPYSGGGGIENRASATAMALLAFQGAGHTHRVGEHKNVVSKGISALLKMQDRDGNFFQTGPNHHRLYTQAQCTIALCELYGMTKDPELRKPAQKALDYAAKSQSPLGGWRYTPREDSDTSVSGWFMMALQSGKMAGLDVQSPALDNLSKFLDAVSTDGGVSYGYKIGHEPTVTMTAEALLCRQYLGWARDDERLKAGVALVSRNPIDWTDQNVYYWYYATQVMHHMGGDDWFAWNDVMRNSVPRNQVKSGAETGSWNASNDRWGAHGGRLYTTCLSLYMLEVYYRHLPIYKHANLLK